MCAKCGALLTEVGSGGRRHEIDHLAHRQPVEVDPLDRRLPAEVGEQIDQTMAAQELARSVRADKSHRQLVAGTSEVPQELQRGRVGPVQVVQHRHRRTGHREQCGDRIEQHEPFCVRVAEHEVITGEAVGHEGDDSPQRRAVEVTERREVLEGEMTDEVGESLDPGSERHREVFYTGAEQDRGAVLVGAPGHLCGERRLADAGLTRHEHHVGSALLDAARPHRLEALELGGPATEGEQHLA